MFFFFFSSRRRHTRSTRDWSSDVCSSDLDAANRLFTMPQSDVVMLPIPMNNAAPVRQMNAIISEYSTRSCPLSDLQNDEIVLYNNTSSSTRPASWPYLFRTNRHRLCR